MFEHFSYPFKSNMVLIYDEELVVLPMLILLFIMVRN